MSPIVSLLLQFFKFYAEKFDFSSDVVSIRTNRARVLSRAAAFHQAGGGGVKRYFYYVPLVVQDPFELSHNVAKLLDHSVLADLLEYFQDACFILERELKKKSGPYSIVSLFGEVPSKTPVAAVKPLLFSIERVANLLKSGRASKLVQHLEELDLNSSEIRAHLGQLVLRELVSLLESRYKFICEPVDPEEEEEDYDTIDDRLASGCGAAEEVVREEDEKRGSDTRKRKHSLGEQEAEEEMDTTDSKRIKTKNSQLEGLDILHSLLSVEPHPHNYSCTVHSNTWFHTRRARRQLSHASQGAECGSQPDSPPQWLVEGGTQPQPPSQGAEGVTQPQPTSQGAEGGTQPYPPFQGAEGGSQPSQGGEEPHSNVTLQLQLSLKSPPPVPLLTIDAGGPSHDERGGELCVVTVTKLAGSLSDFYMFLAVFKKVLYGDH